MKKILISVVDDHQVAIGGINDAIRNHKDIEIVSTATSIDQANINLRNIKFHVALIDFQFTDKQENGLDLIKRFPSLGIDAFPILYSEHKESELGLKAFLAGARGYIHKTYSYEYIVKAIRIVAEGGLFFLPGTLEGIKKTNSSNPFHLIRSHLSDRQWEILVHTVNGMDVKEIADVLNCSDQTIYSNKRRALAKLEIRNDVLLTKYFIDNNILELALNN